MKPAARGLSVGIVGASSLLGKELQAVLKERNFPVARLVTAESDEAEFDMPVVDLREGFQPALANENLEEEDFQVVFVAAPPRPSAKKLASGRSPGFLDSADRLAHAAHCTVIDMAEALAGQPGEVLRVPFLEPASPAARATQPDRPAAFLASAHPASILLSTLILRLARRFTLSSAVAEVFACASEIGPQAVDELQRQTTSLLSFQKIPQAVFGRQLAFNLLPRFGRAKGTTLAGIEGRIHRQLNRILGERAPSPAVRVFQAPVFHSLAVSLYVETQKAASVEALEEALKGPRVTLARLREPAPSQADSSGSSDIQVDAVARDHTRSRGAWIWAVADNLRLAALNAIEIAEGAHPQARASGAMNAKP
jgi:aspartate-semialdehyde dehydrogenase